MVEDWQLDFEWLRVQHLVKDMFNRDDLPDLRAMLFLIGIREKGDIQESYTKEEKQDLMHIAVCTLLEQEGYYEFEGLDADGWPHFKRIRKIEAVGIKEQEVLLKTNIIQYFAPIAEDHLTAEE